MDISVVVPTYNRRTIVSRALDTLFAQKFSPERFEVIVVVDGSTDGTAEELSKLKPECKFRVIEQENRGLAGARNTGFRVAQSDLVLFLDDDMLCDPGLLEAHLVAHRESRECVVFGALFLSSDSTMTLASECFGREIGAFHLRHRRDAAAPWSLTDCVFSNSSLPKKMLQQAGGFDEQFRMREDLELGLRLRARGVCMRYAPEAIAWQYYDKTVADLLSDAEGFAVADLNLARKHPHELIEGHLQWIENQKGLKSKIRGFAASHSFLEELFLVPVCKLGEAFIGIAPFRDAGVRALQMRRRLHWLRVVDRLKRF